MSWGGKNKNDTWMFPGSKSDGWIFGWYKKTNRREERRSIKRRKEGRKDVNTSVF